jgi:hypothetical protein
MHEIETTKVLQVLYNNHLEFKYRFYLAGEGKRLPKSSLIHWAPRELRNGQNKHFALSYPRGSIIFPFASVYMLDSVPVECDKNAVQSLTLLSTKVSLVSDRLWL